MWSVTERRLGEFGGTSSELARIRGKPLSQISPFPEHFNSKGLIAGPGPAVPLCQELPFLSIKGEITEGWMVGYFSGSSFLSSLTCVSCATPPVSADREADGAGAPGVAQLAQEAGVLPAGPAGHRRGKETRKEASYQ